MRSAFKSGARTQAAIASMGAFVLIVITAYCPTWVCISPLESGPSHSCCPNHKTSERPPCGTTSQTCPYLLLEKSKALVLSLAIPAPTAGFVQPLDHSSMAAHTLPLYVPDLSGLYLRNRILLI
jgi:hypothetical protein